MLYGYGDDKNPYTETVDFLEDLVMEFISEMTHKSMEIGRQGRVQVCFKLGFKGKTQPLFMDRWKILSSLCESSRGCTQECASS